MKTPLTTLLSYALMLIASTATAMSAENVDFESQIKPIFEKYCLECHGEETEEAFRIDVNSDMMLYVNEGHPETSDLYDYMTLEDHEENLMPPVDHEPRPEASEIQLVSAWIAQGASTEEGGATGVMADGDTDAAAAAVSPETQRMYNALGSLHTAAIHLPIGLLLAAGLFALLSLGGSFVMSDCAYYCLCVGTLGAIFATASGWFFSPMENRGTVNSIADFFDQEQPIYWHRLGAVITTVVAILLCLFAKAARGRNPDDGMMWKLGAIILAGGIGWVGHTGGELTHGKDHYKDLNELVESVVDQAKGAMAPKAEKADAGDDTEASEGNDDMDTIDSIDGTVEEGELSGSIELDI